MPIDEVRNAVRESYDWFVKRRSEFLTEDSKGRFAKSDKSLAPPLKVA